MTMQVANYQILGHFDVYSKTTFATTPYVIKSSTMIPSQIPCRVAEVLKDIDFSKKNVLFLNTPGGRYNHFTGLKKIELEDGGTDVYVELRILSNPHEGLLTNMCRTMLMVCIPKTDVQAVNQYIRPILNLHTEIQEIESIFKEREFSFLNKSILTSAMKAEEKKELGFNLHTAIFAHACITEDKFLHPEMYNDLSPERKKLAKKRESECSLKEEDREQVRAAFKKVKLRLMGPHFEY